MKTIVIALLGAADQPTPELGDKTPFDLAKIPNLNFFAKNGKVGSVALTSNKLEPSADVAFFNLLGFDAEKSYTGQGPLEAADLELSLEENEIAFRMNFITEADGNLADATAGGITTKEAKALINYLNKKVASDFVRFFAGSEHRHIAVIKDAHGYEALSAKTASPEWIEGSPIEQYFPKGPGDELLKKLMFDAKLLLQDHEINQVRVDLGENPANMIWLWGQGQKPRLETFIEKHGLSGAIITNREYAKGLARLAHLTAIESPILSDDAQSDYGYIAELMQEALTEKDFVCLHLDACEEASRLGDSKAKISSLEAIDYFVLSKVKRYLEDHKDVRVLVTPGIELPWKTRKPERSKVPFVMMGKNIMADDIEKFSETTGSISDFKFKNGHELMESFLTYKVTA